MSETTIDSLSRAIPPVWGEDDGETWTAVGHVDPLAMVLGVIAVECYCIGPADAIGWLIESGFDKPKGHNVERDWVNAVEHLVGCVRHIHMRERDGTEFVYPCEPSDPGAKPFTLLEIR